MKYKVIRTLNLTEEYNVEADDAAAAEKMVSSGDLKPDNSERKESFRSKITPAPKVNTALPAPAPSPATPPTEA